jgi:hypothetical protein
LDVVGGICYKPLFVGGAVSVAPIYRAINTWKGTPVFDEFTLDKSDESQHIIQILNCGFQRGKPVLRCDTNGDYKVLAFDPFGGKVIASRRPFKDRALESRCITEIMKMTVRNDIPIDLTSKFFEKRQDLQNKLLMYRFKTLEKIQTEKNIPTDFGNILPRVKQTLLPFTVLFQHDQKQLTNFISYAQDYNAKIVEENAESFDGQIFNAYIQLLEEHEEEQQTLDDYEEPVITSSKIRDVLINNGWKEDKITSATIGRHLKGLGFTNKPKKIGGKTVKPLIIDTELYKQLKLRYEVTAVTEVTVVTERTSENLLLNNDEKNGGDESDRLS